MNGFHGRTLATMAASGKPGWDTMFPPKMDGFVKVPFGDASAVEAAIRAETVAVLVEPIQGEGGVVVPRNGYLRELRDLADARGILLMVDEIQTGVARTGRLFAHEHDGIVPDVMTLGKGLGGGVPLAALLAAERAACFERGEQGGTFSGSSGMTAVGCAVLEAVTAPEFLDEVVERGAALRDGLSRLPGVVEVRGRGLLAAAKLDEPRAEMARDAAFEIGLLVNAVRPDTLRFMPALTVTNDEVQEMLGAPRACAWLTFTLRRRRGARLAKRISVSDARSSSSSSSGPAPWHFLNFFPEPHGHRSFRPTFDPLAAGDAAWRHALRRLSGARQRTGHGLVLVPWVTRDQRLRARDDGALPPRLPSPRCRPHAARASRRPSRARSTTRSPSCSRKRS